MDANTAANCFVISPIGDPDSDTRRYADKVLNHIIKRSLMPAGFKVVRADEISEPGTINLQVIRRIVSSELVVADLTGTNPNVMYELAIRHASQKPVILMLASGASIPFDIASERTILYDLNDIESIDNARDQLAQQGKAVLDKQFRADTPFAFIEGMSLTPAKPADSNADQDDWRLALLDDVGLIKGMLKKISEQAGEARPARLMERPVPNASKWIKIRMEFPAEDHGLAAEVMEFTVDESLESVLNEVYSLLVSNEHSAFKPEAYTYLWDWVLVREKDGAPLIVRGFQYAITAGVLFAEGDTWQVLVLDEPLLNRPERFNIHRAVPPGWEAPSPQAAAPGG